MKTENGIMQPRKRERLHAACHPGHNLVWVTPKEAKHAPPPRASTSVMMIEAALGEDVGEELESRRRSGIEEQSLRVTNVDLRSETITHLYTTRKVVTGSTWCFSI